MSLTPYQRTVAPASLSRRGSSARVGNPSQSPTAATANAPVTVPRWSASPGELSTDSCRRHPHNEALQLHIDLASAIQRDNGDQAHAAMLGIMQRAFDEMSLIWENESTERDR